MNIQGANGVAGKADAGAPDADDARGADPDSRAFTTHAAPTDGDRAPFAICQSMSSFMLSDKNPKRDKSRTEVMSRDGKVLVQRANAASACQAA